VNYKEALAKAITDGVKVRKIGAMWDIFFDENINQFKYHMVNCKGVKGVYALSTISDNNKKADWEVVIPKQKFQPKDLFYNENGDIGFVLEYVGFKDNEHTYKVSFNGETKEPCHKNYKESRMKVF
jgi:hypothetical protein